MTLTHALRALAAGYNRTLTDAVVESYLEGVEDLEVPALLAGMALAKRNQRFFPPVAVLRECARLADHAAPAANISRPQLEDGDVWCKACSDCGWRYIERHVPASEGPMLAAWVLRNMNAADRERLRAQWGERVPMYPNGQTKTTATPCECRAENPMYQWARQQMRRQGARTDHS